MKRAYREVADFARQPKCDLRIAAYALALSRSKSSTAARNLPLRKAARFGAPLAGFTVTTVGEPAWALETEVHTTSAAQAYSLGSPLGSLSFGGAASCRRWRSMSCISKGTSRVPVGPISP